MNPQHQKAVKLVLTLLFLCLLPTATPQKTSVTTQPQIEHTTVVEGNHFYSNYELSANYNIADVNVTRPIIFILRKKQDNQIFDNPINITLISGQKSVECVFKSFQGMCFLDNLPSSDMTMRLKCDHLPCELSWTIMQPSINKLQQKQTNLKELYDVSAVNDHMIAMITCNNPEIKDLASLITAYSQNQFIKGSTNDIIYLLFKKFPSGHLYLKMQPKAQACAQMIIHNVSQSLTPEQYHKDFIFSNESTSYQLPNRPQNQFRLDCSFHQMSKQVIKSELTLKLTGQKNSARQVINNVTIKPPIPVSDFQFSWAIPTVPTDYNNLQIQARSSNAILILNFYLMLSEKLQIQEGQYSYFSLKQGNKLFYKLIPQAQAPPSQETMLVLGKPKELRISKKSCPKKQGCQFQIEAIQTINSVVYVGKSQAGAKAIQAIFVQFKGSITKKIRDEQTLYLKTPIKKDQVVQIVVNNPNVIIRASNEQVCKVPNTDCYEHIANSNHPFIYQPKKDGSLLFAVEGLDVCQFTISVIDEGTDRIQLKDGEPFMYMMDDHESRLEFKFVLPEKVGTSFNLIAPLNDLVLVVNNGKEKPDADQHQSSSDGYISFSKQELQSKQFRVLVQKTPEAKNKYVHFTLIASTSGTNLRLDPGVAHTDTLKQKQYKQYVFQFDKKGDYILNFYTPSIDKTDMKIVLKVNNQDKWTDGDKPMVFNIDRNSDILNLKDVSEQLCIQEGDVQCEIFIRIQNQMKHEIDITITLLVKDSVIELKDGLWQTYAINTIATTSHFYFVPKAKNSSVDIMYKSTLVDIGIAYTIWKSDKQNINPQSWPFPPYRQNVQQKNSFMMSVNHIMIDHENIKICWPECVILLSLYRKKGTGAESLYSLLEPNYLGNFSIMAANKMLELPEKTKIEIMLKEGQDKYMMVDLKHALKKQALTFFTNEILGSFNMYASVYSQKNPRCPNDDEHDFNFGQVQTQIKMQSILNKRQQNDMSDDADTFLCILVHSYLQSKLTIEYTSDDQIIKLLHFDSFQRFSISSKEVKYYQLEAYQKYQLKFTREKGYFYVKIEVCKNEKDKGYQQCLEQFQDGQNNGKQIITKTQEFTEQPCKKCIVFVRIYSEEPAEGVIHVQSQYSIVSLKQKDILSDFTNQNQKNRYSITSVQDQQTIINIAVTEGDPIVTVSNYYDLNITKQKNPKTNNILIVIPPQTPKTNNSTDLGKTNYDAFAYSSTFRYFTVTVQSKDPKLSTAYTISYSSGERQTYLEDGLVISHTLQAKKKSVYFYKNPSLIQHGYLTITMGKSSTLYNLDFKMFSYANQMDEDSRVDITPVKPPMRKHTPNPTIVYSLPVCALMSIQLESQTQQKVTLAILHQQLVILPFDQQFPYQLHNKQTINFIADVNNPGYLLLSLRKCDKSSPDFGYTFDYDAFQKGEFQYTTNLADDPKFQFYIKASKIGTLYMQMNSTDDTGLFAMSIHYSSEKIKPEKAKVGKNGILQYKIVDSNQAKISFTGVVCSGSKCSKQVKYYWMAGNNIQDVYTQTVCPYSFFQVLGIQTSEPINITQITDRPDSNGVITFSYPYKDHVTYLSVKAVIGDQQVYYQPIEVITIWGTIQRSSKVHKMKIGVAALVFCLCACICFRRRMKKGDPDYEKLPEFNRDGYES